MSALDEETLRICLEASRATDEDGQTLAVRRGLERYAAKLQSVLVEVHKRWCDGIDCPICELGLACRKKH